MNLSFVHVYYIQVQSTISIYLPSFSFCLDDEGMIGVLSISNGLES